MKSIRHIICVWCSFLLAGHALAANATEKVLFTTDRSLYLSGETVHFSAVLQQDMFSNATGSNLVYAEVLNQKSERVAGSKFLLENGQCAGSLSLDKNLVSGHYYLRVYTNVMKNNPDLFSYQILSIINRMETVFMEDKETVLGRGGAAEPHSAGQSNAPYPVVSKEAFAARETVEISLENWTRHANLALVSLAVVPAKSSALYPLPAADSTTIPLKSNRFVTEHKGLSVSGVVADSLERPMKNVLVNLTVLSNPVQVVSQYSTENGHFYLQIPPGYGNAELFISAQAGNGIQPVLHVNSDFSLSSLPFEPLPFYLDSAQQALANEMALNQQLAEIFHPVPQKPEQEKKRTADFYGNADNRIVADDYILLPHFVDYVKELLPNVMVQQSKGNREMVIVGPNHQKNIHPPLVIIDGLVLSDYSALWTISTKKIKAIETVHAEFVHGDMTYGGILHVKTKNKDFGGIALPANGIFFDYALLSSRLPVTSAKLPLQAHMPDARNTLLWIPDVKSIRTNGTPHIEFTTGDQYGTYWIVLEGYDLNGTPFGARTSFEVTNVK